PSLTTLMEGAMMDFKRKKSAVLIGLALSISVANAQENQPENQTDNNEESVEVIAVYGTPIRDSQAAAIEAKRNAYVVSDVLAADTIGRFPDQNLADSLGRIPGLAIERDQGQARFINFRGAPFDYTKIAFDGIDVLGAEDGRTPRFDAFPSVITSQIEVNKAITSDMPGESTVGFINIQTFNPFDREGLSFTAELGQGRQQLGDVDIDKYNGRLSYSGEKFGLLVFGSHNLRGRITDNREYEYADTNGDGADDSVVNLDFRSYRGEREDNAFGGRIEYHSNSNHTFFLSSLYSEFIDREERNQFDFDLTEPVVLNGSAYVPVIVVTRLLEDGKYNNSTTTSTLGYDGAFDKWEVSSRINYTETENETFLPIPFSAGAVVGGSVDVADIENPQLTLTQAGLPDTSVDVNVLEFPANFGLIFAGDLDTEATKFKLDLSTDITVAGQDSTLKFGTQFDTREAVGGDTLVFGGFPDEVAINDFITDNLWSSDFDNTIAGRDFDNAALDDAWDAAAGGRSVEFDDDSLISIEEDIIALYAMVTTDYDWGSLVYGVRVEQTDFTSSGTLLNDDGITSSIEAGNDYTNILPSVHANIDLNEEVKLRISASSGLSRPTYSEIRASQSVDPVTLEISGGNPTLDPEESIGADIAMEWYFAEASLLSIGAYYRDIDYVIYPGTSTVDGSVFAPGLIAPGTETAFNSFFNGEDGRLSGLELNFLGTASNWLPEPFDGLGLSANITFIDSEFTAPSLNNQTFSLPGTSDTIYNASIFYEKFGFSARINYQYRDDWLSTTENDSLTEFWAETTRVDFSLRYSLPNDISGMNITFALNGNNITDERDVRYINSRATPNQVEGFGRRWVASVRVDY
ncbi:MAG: TonB-dependent receptor, partial [Pseudomonadota bacterium]